MGSLKGKRHTQKKEWARLSRKNSESQVLELLESPYDSQPLISFECPGNWDLKLKIMFPKFMQQVECFYWEKLLGQGNLSLETFYLFNFHAVGVTLFKYMMVNENRPSKMILSGVKDFFREFQFQKWV